MAYEAKFPFEAEGETYAPQVQVVKKTKEEAEAFWANLMEEDCIDDCDLSEKAEEPASTKTFEERYEELSRVVNVRPSHREILIRTLAFCVQPKEFSVVEDEIQTYPEFKHSGQNPYRLIKFLLDGEGLEQLEIGFDGQVLSLEKKAGLTEDEIDDLIDCFHLRTTEVGIKLAEDQAPARRIGDLFSLFADRRPFYLDLLDFCTQPRKFKEIEILFEGKDLAGLRTLNPEAGMALKPTVLVDNMEKAGAIVWRDGWVLTREGEMFLESVVGKAAL